MPFLLLYLHVCIVQIHIHVLISNAESSHDLTHYLAVFIALGDKVNSDSYNEYKCFNC